MTRKPIPQSETELSYFEGFWRHSSEEEPVRFFYEVAHDGSVLRQIEYFSDGRTVQDQVANYPNAVSKFGFGSLHGACFWENEWDDSEGELEIRDLSRADFDAAWDLSK